MKWITWSAVALASLALPAQGPSIVPVQTIALPGVEGRFDHLAVDLPSQKLFVAALGNNTLEVVDIRANTRARSLTGFHEPQGILVIPGSSTVVVANGQSASVQFVRSTDFSIARTVAPADDADNLRYDAAANRVYVGYGSGALGVIDATSGARLGDVRLGGHPESFQLETSGPRIFVNVPSAGQIAVVNRETFAVTATWAVTEARSNFPMALDEAGHRLFVGCRNPARILIIDTTSGTTLWSFAAVGDADDLFYDAARHRLYVSGGEGFIDVFQEHANGFVRTEHVPTAAGARTSLFVASLNRFYLAVPHRGAQRAEVRVYAVRD